MTPDARRALGDAGEAFVARWYERRGYEVVDRNWRAHGGERGELDLVLHAPRLLVFCEVKTRRSDTFGAPVEAVTLTKQRRIRALAWEWMRAHPATRGEVVRFDVAGIRLRPGGAPELDVVEGAF